MYAKFWKRLFDFTLSLFALIVLSEEIRSLCNPAPERKVRMAKRRYFVL